MIEMTLLPYVQEETTRHGRRVFYFRRRPGPRIRLPDEYGSPEFNFAYDAAVSGDIESRPSAQLRNEIRRKTELALTIAIKRAKTRAKKKGVAFDITVDWALREAERNGFKCALTGIMFFSKIGDHKSRKNPSVPSIDRVDAKRGYTQDNVRIVLFAVNIALLDWGDLVGKRVSMALARTYTRAPAPTRSSPEQKALENQDGGGSSSQII